jgi:hypothetical protein
VILTAVGLVGCGRLAPVATSSPEPTASAEPTSSLAPTPSATPEVGITMATCGGGALESFPVEWLDWVGPPPGDDAPAAELQRLLDTDRRWGGDWIEAARAADWVLYMVPHYADESPHAYEPSFDYAWIEESDGTWEVTDSGGCQPRPDLDLDPDVGYAEFRLAPEETLAEDTTEVGVLVSELACVGGRDATGRILPPHVFSGAEAVTVVITVRHLPPGAYTCIEGPPTPFVLELPEPLGDRALLDGSSIPPRDPETGLHVLGD